MNGKILRVGLAIGGGTGPELAEIFERALHELAAREKMHAEIIRSPREYRTYGTMALSHRRKRHAPRKKTPRITFASFASSRQMASAWPSAQLSMRNRSTLFATNCSA
jgi:hypothetical protein